MHKGLRRLVLLDAHEYRDFNLTCGCGFGLRRVQTRVWILTRGLNPHPTQSLAGVGFRSHQMVIRRMPKLILLLNSHPNPHPNPAIREFHTSATTMSPQLCPHLPPPIPYGRPQLLRHSNRLAPTSCSITPSALFVTCPPAIDRASTNLPLHRLRLYWSSRRDLALCIMHVYPTTPTGASTS